MKNVVISREIKIVEKIEINDTTPPLAQPVKTDDKHDGSIPGTTIPEILKFVVLLIIEILLRLFGLYSKETLDYLDNLYDLIYDLIYEIIDIRRKR